MINETVILLTRFEDCSRHKLAKHIDNYLLHDVSWDLYYYKPLQKIFSKVIVYDYIKRMTEVGVKAIHDEIIDLVRKERPKYVNWLSFHYAVQESTLDAIRKEGAIVVGWFFEDAVSFDEYSRWWIPGLDYCVTSERDVLPKYRELGARVIYTVPNTGMPIDRDWSNVRENYDVCFVGTSSPDREQYISEIKKQNIPVRLFGRGWGGHVPLDEMINIFSTSKINLNFASLGLREKLHIKGRVFEVCLAGGFLLTEYAPGIEEYFEIGKEIACFENAQDMVNKIIYYLNHDEERRTIAQAGWQKANGEYTSFHFISRVFREIEEDLVTRGRKSSLPSRELRMPAEKRKKFANFYFRWAMAFSLENHKGLWRDAFILSLRYYPFDVEVWYYFIIGFLPYPIRVALTKMHRLLSYYWRIIRYYLRILISDLRKLQ